jgi:hypothetical protein
MKDLGHYRELNKIRPHWGISTNTRQVRCANAYLIIGIRIKKTIYPKFLRGLQTAIASILVAPIWVGTKK